MALIRGTSLTGYPGLVSELGGDPTRLLKAAGIRLREVGDPEAFFAFRSFVRAVETAALATATPGFGRRLAGRQGIDILGPVGVAGRTAATVADAFTIFHSYLSAYSPAISAEIQPLPDPRRSFFEFRILFEPIRPQSQTMELSLGFALQVFRFLIGPHYRPTMVHIPHEPLTPREDYLAFFGCRPRFAEPRAGFTLRSSDLGRPVSQDRIAHDAVVRYLDTIVTPQQRGMTGPVRELVRRLLPTGAATLELVAAQFALHTKTLQRRLGAEGTTFAQLVDQVRKETAVRYLRDTDLGLTHLSRELGYAEQSVLSRSCVRWFGQSPAAHRQALRATARTTR